MVTLIPGDKPGVTQGGGAGLVGEGGWCKKNLQRLAINRL